MRIGVELFHTIMWDTAYTLMQVALVQAPFNQIMKNTTVCHTRQGSYNPQIPLALATKDRKKALPLIYELKTVLKPYA